jgi:hypothetical protein
MKLNVLVTKIGSAQVNDAPLPTVSKRTTQPAP